MRPIREIIFNCKNAGCFNVAAVDTLNGQITIRIMMILIV
jgi:hypothetical protein